MEVAGGSGRVRDRCTLGRGQEPDRGGKTAREPAGVLSSSLAQHEAAAAVVAALAAPAGTYNVADDQPLRRAEWVASLASALGVARPKPIPSWITPLGGPAMRFLSRSERISNRKFRDVTGWAPKYPAVLDAWSDVLQSLHDARAAA